MEKKMEKKFKNLTPHPIVVRIKERSTLFHVDQEGFELPPDEWERDITIMPEGVPVRVDTIEVEATPINGIPCIKRQLGRVQGLPPKKEGVFIIVSSIVFEASDRDDLVVPDTGPTCVRDKDGRIVAVRRFIRK